MDKWNYSLLVAVALLLVGGCAAPSHSAPNAAPTPETPKTQVSPPSDDAVLELVELRFGDRNDRNSRVLLSGRPGYTGEGDIVGISGRIERYTLVDGTRMAIIGPWQLFNADELGYGTPTPVVQGCFLIHDRPWPEFARIRLRIRAAVAERIEQIDINNFQPGMQQQAAAHGLELTIRSRLGKALGRYDATFVHPEIAGAGSNPSTDALSVWSLTPAERQAADEASMWINYRTGFVDDRGLLITPAGQASAEYHFLGQNYAGRPFRATVPVNVRIMDQLIDIDVP